MQQLLSNTAAVAASIRNALDVGKRDRRGSIAIMTAMVGVVLIGVTALSVDAGIWESNVSTMQGAADQAALAAGLAMSSGSYVAQQEAKGLAAANNLVDGIENVSVAVNIPPSTGSYAANAGAVEVVITQSQQGFLSGAFLKTAFTATARAVAIPSQANTSSQGGTCIMALAPTGSGIVGNGNVSIDAATCNIYVNSSSPCDVALSGNASIQGFDVFLGEQTQTHCSSGNSQISAKDKLLLGAAPALDPYGSRTIPRPSNPCTTVNTSSDTITLNPGTYCGLTLSGNKTVTLNSGVYVFDGGGVTASGNTQINGNNVTLVFTSSSATYGGFSTSGNSNVTLTPMTSGPTAGMAMWLDIKGAATFTASGNSNFAITGAVYAPGSAVTWSGNASTPCTQLIAHHITLSGNASFEHSCSGLGVADVGSAGGYKLTE